MGVDGRAAGRHSTRLAMKDGEVRVGDIVETIHFGVIVEVVDVQPSNKSRGGLFGDWLRGRDLRSQLVSTYGPQEFVRKLTMIDALVMLHG